MKQAKVCLRTGCVPTSKPHWENFFSADARPLALLTLLTLLIVCNMPPIPHPGFDLFMVIESQILDHKWSYSYLQNIKLHTVIILESWRTARSTSVLVEWPVEARIYMELSVLIAETWQGVVEDNLSLEIAVGRFGKYLRENNLDTMDSQGLLSKNCNCDGAASFDQY